MDGCEYALLDRAGSSGNSVIGGTYERPTFQMVVPFYDGHYVDAALSDRVLRSSPIIWRDTGPGYAFTHCDSTVSNSYPLTQSSADHCHPITNTYPSPSYHYSSSHADSGGGASICERNAGHKWWVRVTLLVGHHTGGNDVARGSGAAGFLL